MKAYELIAKARPAAAPQSWADAIKPLPRDLHDLSPLTAAPDHAMHTAPPSGNSPADALERWRAAQFGTAPRFAGLVARSDSGDVAADVNAARAAAAKAWMNTAREVAPGFRIDVPGGFSK